MEPYQKVCLFFTFVVGIVIFWVSTWPGTGVSHFEIPLLPILYHAGIFFLFTCFLFLATGISKKFVPLILLVSLFYAVLDELHQYFVPGRAAVVFDVGCDFIGAVVAIVFLGILSLFCRME